MTEPHAPRIMLIEDNPDHAFYIEKGLSRRGFEIEWFSEGASALARAREKPPDAILLDVMLPGMHGLEILRELKGDGRTLAVPVIVVTAYATLQLHREKEMALVYGAADFFKKPFKVDELATVLRKILKLI
jgi:two-component system OmpR family response regulator